MSAAPSAKRTLLLAAAFAAAALATSLALRGFMVDDALITARYAASIASGAGHRLNPAGPVTDGVTPLLYPYVLAPFARAGALSAFAASKWLGQISWLLGAGVVGAAAARLTAADAASPADAGTSRSHPAGESHGHPRPRKYLWLIPFLLIATSAPLGAWAVSGMETGLVTLLASLAASLPLLSRPRAAAACAGLAASLRPELLPWAAVLGVGLYLADRRSPRAWLSPILAAAPFLLTACIRVAAFGRPAPLSIYAKAPDLAHGAAYALACALLAGPPALLAPLALRRLSPLARVLPASVLVHLLAIALAGGDWMPLSRLMVPVLPSLALAALLVAQESRLPVTAARVGLALAGQLYVLLAIGPVAARVGEDRFRVLDELRHPLSTARVVASLDIGWVGAATPATIVDLAGVTDPAIAALPGGHTTKRIPANLLDAREVDTLVLLLAPGQPLADPWTSSRFARGVESWIATTPGIAQEFAPVAETSLPDLRYVVLRRITPGSSAPFEVP